jgi:hypothetical protein
MAAVAAAALGLFLLLIRALVFSCTSTLEILSGRVSLCSLSTLRIFIV